MNTVLSVFKPIGLTPLEVIAKVKETFPQYTGEKISYAGRLDPLAHGVLLLMIGDAGKERERYLNLRKAYTFEVLFGIETDTYDLLGFPHSQENKNEKENDVNLIVKSFANKHIGKQLQSYPPYSSKTVQGKPLFWWARQNKLSEITIPKHEIEIFRFELASFGTISQTALREKLTTAIDAVQGDFRQEETLKRWDALFQTHKQKQFKTAQFSVDCSSGTYIRQLAHELGAELGCGAIAMDILRTKVGEYTLEDCLKLPF